MNNNPIGIFDSGVGGLTVLCEIERILPNENIIYFGDTARVPYGNKSKSTIIKFSTENIIFLLKKQVKMIVVACNTASALALEDLKEIFTVPLLGVIEAGASKALKVTKNKKIGIIGTRSTVTSRSYEKEFFKQDKDVKVYSCACPLFVPLVEEAIYSGEIVNKVVRMYLKDLKQKGIDTIILGCTHYPVLKKKISDYLKGVRVIDSAREIALHTKEALARHNLLNQRRQRAKVEFYVTDEAAGFAQLAKVFLKRKILKPKVVNV